MFVNQMTLMLFQKGIISDQTVLFDKLVTNDDVEEVMKTYPEKYKKMFKDVFQ